MLFRDTCKMSLVSRGDNLGREFVWGEKKVLAKLCTCRGDLGLCRLGRRAGRRAFEGERLPEHRVLEVDEERTLFVLAHGARGDTEKDMGWQVDITLFLGKLMGREGQFQLFLP